MSWVGKDDALVKTKATAKAAAAWRTELGNLAGLTGPLREQDVMPVADALEAHAGLLPAEAAAIASWLGGYAHSTSFLSNAFQLGDADVYMDVESLVDDTNGARIGVGDALRKLRNANAAAHAWVIDRAEAKRDKKALDSDADLEQHRLAVVNTEIAIATGAGKEVLVVGKGLYEGVNSLIDDAGKALANPLITIALVAVVVLCLGAVFLVVRSRVARLVS